MSNQDATHFAIQPGDVIQTPYSGVMYVPFKETYGEMVKNLFKPLPTLGEILHHATTGISGEVGELADAMTRKNIIEECGDIEFYLKALKQNIDPFEKVPLGMAFSSSPFGSIFHAMTVSSAIMLDLTKKVWIYGKPVPTQPLSFEVQNFRNLLSELYLYIGTTKAEVRHLNQLKLRGTAEKPGRYFNGYTNEAAIARVDKA